MIQAFGIFIQHWLKEENAVKADRWRENLRMRQVVACERILLSRRIVNGLKLLVAHWLDMIEQDNLGEDEEVLELVELIHELVKDVIQHREIYGVCNACNQGLVRFCREGYEVLAVCGNCKSSFLRFFF